MRKEILIARLKTGEEIPVTITAPGGFVKAEANGEFVWLDHRDGKPYIRFLGKDAERVLSKKVNVKPDQDCYVQLESDWREIERRWIDEDFAKAKGMLPVSFSYRCGCDSGSSYRFQFEHDGELMDEAKRKAREQFAQAEKLLEKFYAELTDGIECEKLEGDGSSYYSDRYDADAVKILLQRCEKKQAEVEEAARKKKLERDVDREEKFRQARETGKPVALHKPSMDECDGSVDDCSFDSITDYAMPDGTVKTIRSHCY